MTVANRGFQFQLAQFLTDFETVLMAAIMIQCPVCSSVDVFSNMPNLLSAHSIVGPIIRDTWSESALNDF